MAQGNFRAYLQGDEVWLKKYLYVLRPVLGVLWLEQKEEPVPMEFQTMVDKVVSDPVVRNAIEDLLDRKRSGSELDRGPRIGALSNFIERQLERMEKTSYEWKTSRPPPDALNQLFRSIVYEVWGYT